MRRVYDNQLVRRTSSLSLPILSMVTRGASNLENVSVYLIQLCTRRFQNIISVVAGLRYLCSIISIHLQMGFCHTGADFVTLKTFSLKSYMTKYIYQVAEMCKCKLMFRALQRCFAARCSRSPICEFCNYLDCL